MLKQTFLFPKFNLFEKKYLASRIACVVFFILAFFYLFESQRSAGASFVAYLTMALLTIQFVFQFKALNGIIGGLMLLGSLYFSLAVWSEFNEFEVVTESAKQLLMFGFGGTFVGILLSVFMLWSFIRDF